MTKRKDPTEHVVQVVLRAPRQTPDLIVYGKHVHDQLAANAATFPAPTPPLPKLQGFVDGLRHAAAQAPSLGVAGASHVKQARDALMGALEGERQYVESIAAATPQEALAIALRAGMDLKRHSPRSKPPLELRHGSVSRTVVAIAKAIHGALTYYWQYSLDGVTWIDRPMTDVAHTQIDDLTPGTMVWVRVRAMTRKETTDWVATASIMVL